MISSDDNLAGWHRTGDRPLPETSVDRVHVYVLAHIWELTTKMSVIYRNVPIKSALGLEIVEGASIPRHFGNHGGAYSVFWHMTVQTSQQQWSRFWSTRAGFNCACVYKFRKVRIRGARRLYFVKALLFRDNVQTHVGGASIR